MDNSVIDFENWVFDNLSLKDYSTFELYKVYQYSQNCNQEYFDLYQMEDDDKIERISYELYGSAMYWDILLLINGRDPLFGMSYNFNCIYDMANRKANSYNNNIKTTINLPGSHISYMESIYEEEYKKINEENRVIKVVKPSLLQEFIRECYDEGIFV